MPQLKRRHFLQAAGSTLATMGLSQLDFLQQADRYGKVLAQNTPGKLALLVGINAYKSLPLLGCVTDTELQYELLRHRYGFKQEDILVLTDDRATRQNILTAFEEHLIKQAKPNDVVVFHFSGHGWMVRDPDPNPGFVFNGQGVNGTLIPYDWDAGEPETVRNIMGHTLFLLMSALKTENVTAVLDSCHSGGGLRGNAFVRAFSVRTYQQRWLSDPRVNLTLQQFTQKRKAGIAKGVGVGSATLQQEALDARFNGFNAGAFTYLLTRYLWQLPIEQSVETLFTNLVLSTQTYALDASFGRRSQDPMYEVQPGRQHQRKPLFFTSPVQPVAEAVVRETPKPGQPIKFWLGGVSSNSLGAYESGSIFTIIDHRGNELGQIKQSRRNGLEATGELHSGNVQVREGMLLREGVREVPDDLKLKIGLHPSLEDVLPAVQKALSGMNRIEVVPVAQQQDAHYLLGRVGADNVRKFQQQGLKQLPSPNGICLFTPAFTPMPESFGSADESIDAAVQRLRLRLRALLAGLILRSILGDASTLKVSAEVFLVNTNNQPISPARTLNSRSIQEATIKTQAIVTLPLKAGSDVMIRVKNEESVALYIAALVIANSGELGVLYPFGYEAPIDAALMKAQEEKLVPIPFTVQGPAGFFELLILASREPLRNALLALRDIAKSRGVTRGEPAGLEGDEPVKVVTDLLGDIDRMSRASLVPSARTRAVDIDKLAALSALFQVVE
jgi:hypothetical protein